MSDSFNPCSLGCFPRSVLLTGNEKIKASFNPCSLGCFPRRVNMMNQITHQNGFNPCSLGCFPRSLQGSGLPLRRVVSILVLLDVFLEVFPSDRSISVSRFNPCSLGCFPRSLTTRGITKKVLQFQSLFSWMFSSKFPGDPVPRFLRLSVSILVLLDVFLEVWIMVVWSGECPSFNPCSLGCFPRRVNRRVNRLEREKFQSLFSWMFSSKIVSWIVFDPYA